LDEFDFAFEVGDIGGRSGREVIQDGDCISSGDQSIGKVGADKTCTTGDKYAHMSSLRADLGVRGDGLSGGIHLLISKLSGL
jgi:hypothetical protein